MSSRNRRVANLEAADPFASAEPATNPSLREVDEAIFGSLNLPDLQHLTATGMLITNIRPHPAQPRRVLPSSIRKIWNGNVEQLGDVFDQWADAVADERGRDFDVREYLNQITLPDEFEADRDHPEPRGALELSFLDLLELAISIKHQGLMNPITVASQGKLYTVETGERRWFAYHLLYHYTGDKKFTTIPARIVPQVDVWRQATENTARQNLNAIGRARQLAILIMDLLKTEQDMQFAPMSQFDHEQGYYAQVQDGMDMRIPRNSADKLLAATGFKTKEQLRQHRALLRLPVRVWELADDLNWPERVIRDMLSEARGDEDKLYRLALQRAAEDGYNVSTGTVSHDPDNKTRKRKPLKNTGPNSAAYYTEFVKLLGKAGPGKPNETQAALERLVELQNWLYEQQDQLQRYLSDK